MKVKHSIDYVFDMLEIAEELELVPEIVLSFGFARSQGMPTEEATVYAVGEWVK